MRHLVFFLAFLPFSAFAELKFDEKVVNLTAQPQDAQVTAIFKFTNTGSQTVTIKQVESNCGCIRAEADKESYAKGEAGQIEAVFSVGSFEGEQSKNIFVIHESAGSGKSEEGEGPTPVSERLTVNITVPAIIEVEPKLTKWQQGADLEEQKIMITMKHDEPIHIKEVKLSRDQITAKLVTIEEGKKYEIVLTPNDLEKPLLGMITLITDCAIEKHQRKMAFFSIERKKISN